MITRPTVLVLGAGASRPFGFPTGAELREEVIKLAADPPAEFSRAFDWSTFGYRLRNAGAPSVDWFLERNPQFYEVGKIAMAFRLLARETDTVLLDESIEDHWYQYLWSRILDTREGRFQDNPVSVVTFNYDRSFERFLLLRLAALWGRPDEVATEEAKNLRVIHVYGSLGDREFKQVRYNVGRLPPDYVRMASQTIRIVSEGTEARSEVFAEAREVLEAAEIVCFLGFGFHVDNVFRLDLPALASRKPYTRWFASRKGLTDYEFEDLTRHLSGKLIVRSPSSDALTVAGQELGCRETLRQLPVFAP